MKISDILIKKLSREARIKDKYQQIEQIVDDAPGQQMLPGVEDQNHTQVLEVLKKLSALEEEFWETFDGNATGNYLKHLDDIADYEPTDDEINSEAESYLDSGDMVEEFTEGIFDSWHEEDKQEAWGKFIKERANNGSLTEDEAVDLFKSLTRNSDTYINIISSVLYYFEKYNPQMSQKFTAKFEFELSDNGAIIKAQVQDLLNSNRGAELVKFISDAMVDADSQDLENLQEVIVYEISDLIIGEYYQFPGWSTRISIAETEKDFKKFLSSTDYISDERLVEEIKDRYADSISESLSESHEQYVKEDAGEYIQILTDMSNHMEPELNELLKLNEFFKTTGGMLKEKENWVDEYSPILDQAQELMASLPPDVSNLLDEKSPKSDESSRKDQRQLYNLLLHFKNVLDRDVSIDEVSTPEGIEKLKKEEEYVDKRRELARLLGKTLVHDDEYRYYLQNPNYVAEYKQMCSILDTGSLNFYEFMKYKDSPESLNQAKLEADQAKIRNKLRWDFNRPVEDEEVNYYLQNPNYIDEYNKMAGELDISSSNLTFNKFMEYKNNPDSYNQEVMVVERKKVRRKLELVNRPSPIPEEEITYFLQNPDYPQELVNLGSILNLRSRFVTFEQFMYYKNNPNDLEALKQQVEYERQRNEAGTENEHYDKNKQEVQYKNQVEKKVVPVSDQNQQLVINLVQKLRNKGNVDKQTLQNFLTRFK